MRLTVNRSYYFIIIVAFFIIVLVSGVYSHKGNIKIYLPALTQTDHNHHLDSNHLLGTPYILNVFASWCASCNAEHNLWLSIKNKVSLYGVNYIDNSTQARKYLEEHGNPYKMVGFDKLGVIREELNIMGLPETFVIDKKGAIRMHINGAITEETLTNKIMPLYTQLLNE